MLFGQKSEKYIPSTPDQLMLNGLEEEEVDTKDIIIPSHKKKIKKHPGRNKIPSSIIREITDLIPEEVKNNPADYIKIGEETTEQLQIIPAKFWVKKTVRPKYKNLVTNKIICSSLPFDVFAKCMAGVSVVSDILTKKYTEHLPLYRINKIYKRSNVDIAESTMVGWISRATQLLEPIYRHMCLKVHTARLIQVDETPIMVLSPGNKKTHLGYMYVYIIDKKYCVLQYQAGRGREGPLGFLKGFTGIIQTDGYAGYNGATKEYKLIHIVCMAHIRRKFHIAYEHGDKEAEKIIKIIKRLYDIEREIKDCSNEKRLLIRKEKSTPIFIELENEIMESGKGLVPEDWLSKAKVYFENMKSKMRKYLENPEVDIDNNISERNIRPLTIGRKNYMFLGSEEGAFRASVMYTMSLTCRMHGKDPYKYYTDTFNKMNENPNVNFKDLQPI